MTLESQEFQLVPDTRPVIERIGIRPVLFGYLCIVAFFGSYQIVGGVSGFLIYGGIPTPSQVNSYRLFTACGQILLLLLPAILLARLASTEPSAYLRTGPARWPVYLVPLAGIFALQNMLQVYMILQDRIPMPESLSDKIDGVRRLIEEAYRTLLQADSPAELALVILVIAVVPAFAEEFAFRGLIQRSFERGLGPTRGIVLTGVIFGAFHLNPFSIVPLVVLGIYLGFLAHRADSIWVAVLAHFFNNFILTLAIYFGMGEDAVITGDSSEMPFGMLMGTVMVSGVIFILSTSYFFYLTRPPVGGGDPAAEQSKSAKPAEPANPADPGQTA